MTQRIGLLANLPRVRAQAVLDMAEAINIAIGADPQAIGRLKVQAGADPKQVSRWAQEQMRIQREHKISQRRGFDHES